MNVIVNTLVNTINYKLLIILSPMHPQPLKPGIGEYSSSSSTTANPDEAPLLEMCMGK